LAARSAAGVGILGLPFVTYLESKLKFGPLVFTSFTSSRRTGRSDLWPERMK
jgi:hypothetical protein